MPATLIYAGIVGLLAVGLANHVLYARLRARSLPDWQPPAAERVQANFVENAPLALVLLYLMEVGGAPLVFAHSCGIALVAFRVLHAWGLARYAGANYPRLIGAQGTFVLMAVMSVMLVILGFGIVDA